MGYDLVFFEVGVCLFVFFCPEFGVGGELKLFFFEVVYACGLLFLLVVDGLVEFYECFADEGHDEVGAAFLKALKN